MTFLIVLHVLICMFLVFVILLQPGKSDGGGIGFGSTSQSIFGSKGAGNFLTKTTSVVAILFLATSFFLTRDRAREYNRSVIPVGASAPAAPEAATPEKPKPAEGAAAGTATPSTPATAPKK